MISFYIGILFLCLIGIKISKNGFFEDFIAKDQCNSIKGIFILTVFLRHVLQYILKSGYEFSSKADNLFLLIDRQLGQLIVVMFLFYSGYGVMESIKKKQMGYVDEMPRKRILATLLNFDIAVLAFAVLNLILEKEMELSEILLSFVGWDSIGNSNWYIFDILLCYIIVWIAYKVTSHHKQTYEKHAMIFTVFLFLTSLIVLFLTKPEWWYNTLLCFFAGMLFSKYRNTLISIVKKNYWKYTVLMFLAFAGFHQLPNGTLGLWNNLECIAFAFFIVLTTMKIKVDNKILQWLGKHLFPLYIYQRLTMIALFEIGDGEFTQNNPFLYTIISLIAMVVIAIPFHFWQISFSGQKEAAQNFTKR